MGKYWSNKTDNVDYIVSEDFNNAFADIEEDVNSLTTLFTAHSDNNTNPHAVTKAQVGLSNVDNTSDLDKPVSAAAQAALDSKANAADVYTKAEIIENYPNFGAVDLLLEDYAGKGYVDAKIDDVSELLEAQTEGAMKLQGEVEAFANLPTGAADGDVYRIKTGRVFSNDANSGLITGNFSDFFEDVFGDGEYFNAYPMYVDANYSGYFVYSDYDDGHITYIYDQFGKYVAYMIGDRSSGWPKSMFEPLMTGESAVAFYMSAVKTTFYTVGDLGLLCRRNLNWYPISDAGWIKQELGDIETALDGILAIQNTLIGGGSE